MQFSSMASDWQLAVEELSFDSSCDALADLHGVSALVRSLQLDIVARLVDDGFNGSIVDYLSLHLGMTRHEAREFVRIGKSLLSLPLLRVAFREGRIDWVRLCLVTQIAESAEDDELYANEACNYSITQLKVMVARKKAGDASKAEAAYQRRNLVLRHNDSAQETTISGSVPIDLGLALEAKLQKRADTFGIDDVTGEYRSPSQAMADALCEEVFGEDGPRVDVLVDLEPSAITGDGLADMAGHTVNQDTLRRLLCDASARPSFIDENGMPLSLGRKMRLFPPWLSRQIAHRDRGCRFPGCGSNRWLHDHHMFEWDADVGPTDYDNGIQLCGTHHRFVHEGGWKIRGHPDDALTFVRPDGKEFTGIAPLLAEDLRASIFAMATDSLSRAEQEREQAAFEQELERLKDEEDFERQRAAWKAKREAAWRSEQNRYKPMETWGDPAA